ncbi:MAG: hypothetical protein HYV42_05070 [Candidatus Magasanikbacteria bacterium]|nr:hypothetical protein [Candidatus Magasanikbacteria bacterium]
MGRLQYWNYTLDEQKYTTFHDYCAGCKREKGDSERACPECGHEFRRFYPPYCQACFEQWVYTNSSSEHKYNDNHEKSCFQADWFNEHGIEYFDGIKYFMPAFTAWFYPNEKFCSQCGGEREEVIAEFNLGDNMEERLWEEFRAQRDAWLAKKRQRSWRHRFWRWLIGLLRRINQLDDRRQRRLPPPSAGH